ERFWPVRAETVRGLRQVERPGVRLGRRTRRGTGSSGQRRRHLVVGNRDRDRGRPGRFSKGHCVMRKTGLALAAAGLVAACTVAIEAHTTKQIPPGRGGSPHVRTSWTINGAEISIT